MEQVTHGGTRTRSDGDWPDDAVESRRLHGGSGHISGGGWQTQVSPTRGELRQLIDFMTLTRLPQDCIRSSGGRGPNMSSPGRLGASRGGRRS